MFAFAKEGSLDADKVMGDASAVCRPKLAQAFRFAQGDTVVRTLRLGLAPRGYANPQLLSRTARPSRTNGLSTKCDDRYATELGKWFWHRCRAHRVRHDRHTYGYCHLQDGIDIHTLQPWTGRRDIAWMMVYLKGSKQGNPCEDQ